MTQENTANAFTHVEMTLRAATLDESTRSVQAIAATESICRTFNPFTGERYDEILLMRGGEFPEQVPLFDNHPYIDRPITTRDQLGSVRQPTVEGDKLLVRLFFDDEGDESQRAFRRVKKGHLRNVSIGAKKEQIRIIRAGETATIDGRVFRAANDLDLHVVVRWRMIEVSLTPIGLDPRAIIRTEANINTEVEMSKPATSATPETTDVQRSETPAHPPAADAVVNAPADVQRNAIPAAMPPAVQPTDVQRSTVDVDTIRRQERERIDGIRQIAGNADEAVVTRAINDGWTVERAAHAILQSERDRRGSGAGADNRAPAGHVRDADSERTVEVLGAALMVRGGIALDHRAFANQQVRQALHANTSTRFLARDLNDTQRQRVMDLAHRYADYSLIDVLRQCIIIDGQQVPHSRHDQIDLALRFATSGGSLSNVFSTSVHAQMLATFAETGDSTMGWCREADALNFQTQERTRLTKGAGLQKLPRGGTAEHVSRDDTSESYKLARYAQQFIADEQDVIDDRLNFLADFPQEMAFAARRLRPDLVYSIFFANAAMANGTALFASGHGNTDTGAALADGTLRAALTALSIQAENSVNLNLRATHLITPETLGWTAKQIIRSAEIRNIGDGTSGDNLQFGTYNPLHDENLRHVSDSRLDNGVTDPSTGTAYSGDVNDWFVTDARFPAIEVGYLAGTGRAPQVVFFAKRGEDGQWYMGWSVKYDIGAKAIRARSIVRRQG